ncbi:MAG: DNA internalization-related competence protein ComEC/Rec2 [Smithellaceae bacterium]
MRRPLLYPLIALMAGMLIGDRISLPSHLLLAGTITVLIILLVSITQKWTIASFLLILGLMFIVGLFNSQSQQYLSHQDHHIVHQADQGKRTVEGIVTATDHISPDKFSLIVRCQRILKNHSYSPVTGYIRLTIPSDHTFQYGDFIRFHCSIRRIQSFHNPGSFNYERYLNRQGIYVSGFIADKSSIALIRHNTASGIKLTLETFRLYLKQLIYTNAPSPQREIIEAMTIGNQKAIPQDVRDNFAKTGTSHILSISGLHISMVAAGCFFLIFFLMKFSEYLMLRFNIIKLATAAAIVPVAIYAFVAGMGTTVLRATLMALAFLIALIFGKQKDIYNILFGAAFIILIIAPESLFDISFQLSFSAVFAILYIVSKLSDLTLPIPASAPCWLQTLIRRVYVFILVSAAATLGTLPIIIYYFNRVSTVTLIANLVAVPLLGMVTLIPAMAFILTAICSPWLAGILIKVASFFTGIAVAIINWMASLSWSSFSVVKPNIVEITLFYVILFLLIAIIGDNSEKKDKGFLACHPSFRKMILLIALTLMIANAVYLVLKDQYSTDLKITAIDVGQGSAALFQFPRGINMLIDGGGFNDSSFDIGKSVIAPFLYAQRIRKIDIVVLTHPHPDHLQGLIYILNNFDVSEVWHSGIKANSNLYLLWEKTIFDRKIKIKYLSAQSPPVNISGVHINFLWPLLPSGQDDQEISYDETNDSSMVMKITHGAKSFLVTGDITARAEALLIESGQILKSDLLFVPHHGSLYSSSADFIHSVSSRFAIISAGKKNIFRHPHPAVLDRYSSAGIDIFRTDKDGAISIYSDGKTINITPWLERSVP